MSEEENAAETCLSVGVDFGKGAFCVRDLTFECRMGKDLPVYSPSQSCCLAPQRGSSQDLEGWPGSETHPSSCRVS